MHYEVEGSLTVEQFSQKWRDIYDINYAGIGESFLLGQQVHGVVVISKCEQVSEINDMKFILDTILSDTTYGKTYAIEITVITTDDGFKIDDVKKTEVMDDNK